MKREEESEQEGIKREEKKKPLEKGGKKKTYNTKKGEAGRRERWKREKEVQRNGGEKRKNKSLSPVC